MNSDSEIFLNYNWVVIPHLTLLWVRQGEKKECSIRSTTLKYQCLFVDPSNKGFHREKAGQIFDSITLFKIPHHSVRYRWL